MADAAHTTRRALFAAASLPLLPLAAGLPGQVPDHFGWRAFVQQIADFHPNGAAVAVRALHAGADPDLLNMVQLHSADDPDAMPVLHFSHPGDSSREIVVSNRGVL